VPTPFLDAASVAELSAIRGDAFATRLAITDPTYLVLHRWDEAAEGLVARPVQRVLVKYDARQPQVVGDDSGASLRVGGTFESTPPFDVRTGDRFTLSGQRGHVTLVRPPRNGVQTAEFTIDGGGA